MTSLSYILTVFGDDLDQNRWKVLQEIAIATGNVKYICSQLERCPNTNRLHWQAFIKLFNKQRGSWLKSHIDPRLHFEAVTVEHAEAINYGQKEDTRVEGPIEHGIKPKAVDKHQKGGQRTKEQWDEVKKVIISNDRNAIPTDLVIKYNLEKRIDGLRRFWTVEERSSLPGWLPNPWSKILPTKVARKRRHYWIFSRAPNKGKTTKFAVPLDEEFRCCLKAGDFTYWNLRGDEECVILDEFNTAALKFSTLNSMCDGLFEYRIFQGGLLRLKNPLIIVLSNQAIVDLYPFMNNLLYERFNEIEIT